VCGGTKKSPPSLLVNRLEVPCFIRIGIPNSDLRQLTLGVVPLDLLPLPLLEKEREDRDRNRGIFGGLKQEAGVSLGQVYKLNARILISSSLASETDKIVILVSFFAYFFIKSIQL